LPDDLVAFLTAGRQLEYDPATAEPGMLTLRPLDELTLGAIYMNSDEEGHAPDEHEEPGAGEDPHIDDEETGYYLIPAVDLVASCTGDYPPEGLLAWIPDLGMYATWDSSHLEILAFPNVTWSEITREPLRYVTAQWYEYGEAPPGYYLAPWLHGYEYRLGEPP
jgi:hypothetical protein